MSIARKGSCHRHRRRTDPLALAQQSSDHFPPPQRLLAEVMLMRPHSISCALRMPSAMPLSDDSVEPAPRGGLLSESSRSASSTRWLPEPAVSLPNF